MKIGEAKKYLVDVCRPEYRAYIHRKLPGDFACEIVRIMQAKECNSDQPEDDQPQIDDAFLKMASARMRG